MMRWINFLGLIVLLTGCNSVYYKPNSLDTSKLIFADRGGYSMRRSVKEQMEQRGYTVVVGKAHKTSEWLDNDGDAEFDTTIVPKTATYVVRVKERRESLRPIWCAFNGFWWWNFNISIADQDTGAEILTWRGRGCANSSVRLLDKILDKLEK